MVSIVTAVVASLLIGAAWAAAEELPAKPAAEAIDVGTRKQLFADDFVVQDMKNVYRVMNRPEKYEKNPLIRLEPEQKVGGKELVVVSGSVIYDAEEKLFKMWYEGADYKWSRNVVAYATSRDGIEWTLPELGLIEYNGSKKNNIVFRKGTGEMAPGVFKDPAAKDPNRRYKMIYDNCKRAKGGGTMGVAFSPDGIHWTPLGKTVIPLSDSPNSVLWDPRLGAYVAHTRKWEKLRFSDGRSHNARVVLQSESDDFIQWKSAGTIMKPDGRDPPQNRHFYNMEWMPYGDVYFGFISVYHVPIKGPWWDTIDVQLAFSRDGRTWKRAGDRQVFLPRAPEPGDFDWAMIFVMQRPIVVGDEIWIYYVGFDGLHWATRRNERQGGAVGLAKLRLDGFVSLDPGGKGTVTTKLLRMNGDRLALNANATRSAIRVEILGPDRKALKGFGKGDADPVIGDSVRHTVTWNGNADLGSLKGKPIALRFHLDRCKLYSFIFRDGEARNKE